jgi:L-threonylcarbamoyladenylate synthase
MEYYKLNPNNPDPVSISRTVEVLKEGGIIVYPTDTLYGLGVDITNQKAVNKLLHLKRRNINSPISIMVNSINSMEEIIGPISPKKQALLKNILPGKFTILLKNKSEKVSENKYLWNPLDQDKIGFRIPDLAVCRELSIQLKKPISSTSANISGQESVISIQEVVSYFGNKLDLILDAGPMKSNKGSTVIDLTKLPFMVFREGDISMEQLSEMLPGISFEIRKTKFIVVFVCTGNICRSPLGEGILKAMVEKTKFNDIFSIQSAGTLNLGPVHAHDFSLKVADDNEIDLSAHRARQISEQIVDEASIIFCLAMDHLQYLRKNYPNYRHKFQLLKDWKRDNPLAVPSIADPIGHELKFFEKTYSEIYTEIKRVFPFILNELKKFMEYNEIK